ncbi:MAG: nitrilase [Epsilonproteobacteria bacterium]|nr:nitrilase [Campylobacterota bacterium]NPA89781.1 nitrilase [Campylobacterota bacterium]
MVKVAIAQFRPKLSPDNLRKHWLLGQSTDADIVIFPELSMNGYKIKDALLEDAFEVDYFQQLRSMGKDVVLGAAIREGAKVFNSGIYISKDEIFIHRKVHLPTYGVFEEGRFFFPGNGFETFETKAGKTTLLICEDAFSGDAFNFISREKPDLTIVLSASPARGFKDGGLLIEEQWDAILKSLAVLSGGYVAFSNRVGFEDGLGFWGGSRLVNPLGEVEVKAPYFDEAIIEGELNHKLTLTQKYLLRKEG